MYMSTPPDLDSELKKSKLYFSMMLDLYCFFLLSFVSHIPILSGKLLNEDISSLRSDLFLLKPFIFIWRKLSFFIRIFILLKFKVLSRYVLGKLAQYLY